MGESASKFTTFEEYKKYRAAKITEENIGPQLSVSINKTLLSAQDAYKIFYSYLPTGMDKKLFVQETFTQVKGKVYRIWYYANEETYSKYQNELQLIKNSYHILGKSDSTTMD